LQTDLTGITVLTVYRYGQAATFPTAQIERQFEQRLEHSACDTSVSA